MQITALSQHRTEEVQQLMSLGSPHITARTLSDYWLYARLFSSTCPIALLEGAVIGSAIAMRSQDDPADVYVQDVMTHPDHRRNGVAAALLNVVRQRAQRWTCRRASADGSTQISRERPGHLTCTDVRPPK